MQLQSYRQATVENCERYLIFGIIAVPIFLLVR